MKKYITGLMIVVSLLVASSAFASHQKTAKAVKEVETSKNWYLAQTLESNLGALAGVKYQKIVDEEKSVVCYVAKFGNAISMSCVK